MSETNHEVPTNGPAAGEHVRNRPGATCLREEDTLLRFGPDALDALEERLAAAPSAPVEFAWPKLESEAAAGAGPQRPGDATPLDAELDVRIELGRADLTLDAADGLAPGAVVPLDTEAASPVDVYVGGTRVARGEVVSVDGRFAVRVVELLGGNASVVSRKAA